MKSFDTDIKKYTEKIRLKASERRELRERVFAYMEYHPLAKQHIDVQVLPQSIPSESFVTLHLSNMYVRIAGGIFAVFIVTAPFFAEQSTPGDALYFIKTGVNETIQGQLANSPHKKIEFETKLMERRIAEARVLASEGKLTEEVKQQITDTVKEHTTAVQQGLEELRLEDADEAALAEISFNASLEVQSAVLASDTNIEDSTLVDSIMTVMNDARENVVQNQVVNTASYEGLIAQVELETTRALELFTTIKESATEEEVKDIDRRLSDINRLIDDAKRLHNENPETATGDLATTLGLTQKLIAFMSDIDVRETVSLATLVPIVLSDVERTEQVNSEIKTLKTMVKEVETRLLTLDGDGVREKVEDALTQIDGFILQGTASIEAKDLVSAEVAVGEARALMTDIDMLTQSALVDPSLDTGEPQTDSEEESEEVSTTSPETIDDTVTE